MPEKLLNEDISAQVKEVFNQLDQPVQILYFGAQIDCEYCPDTLALAQEVVKLSDKLALSIYDIDEHGDIAQQYQVDKTPALVIAGRQGDQIMDFGIRYAGIPAGHEFSSLIHDMLLVSGRDSGLAEETRDFLRSLDQPVLLQVFVTPT